MSQAWVGPARSEVGRARRARLRSARLYLVTDDATPGERLPELIREAIAGGVDMVQLRRKAVDPEELVDLAQACRDVCHAGGALFLVDDHVELARAAGADGVHVGQADLDPAQVRAQLGPELLIGLSTHSAEHVVRAATQPIDYLSAGPVYATPTKPGRAAVGFEQVRAAARRSAVPVVAIGGLGPGTVGRAAAAGADIVAVVRALSQAGNPQEVARGLRAEFEAESSWLTLRVNGQQRKCPQGTSVRGYLDGIGVVQDGIVIERNGEILKSADWAGTELAIGDELEVVHLVGGGMTYG
jgi:thiamine-phosphate pyrophosphorylase